MATVYVCDITRWKFNIRDKFQIHMVPFQLISIFRVRGVKILSIKVNIKAFPERTFRDGVNCSVGRVRLNKVICIKMHIMG